MLDEPLRKRPFRRINAAQLKIKVVSSGNPGFYRLGLIAAVGCGRLSSGLPNFQLIHVWLLFFFFTPCTPVLWTEAPAVGYIRKISVNCVLVGAIFARGEMTYHEKQKGFSLIDF